jgi:hypothetical protein
LEGLTVEELEERLLEEEAGDIPGSDRPPLNRGGPLYRIRVTQELTNGQGRTMEALVRIESIRNPPLLILWKRFSLGLSATQSDEQAIAAE